MKRKFKLNYSMVRHATRWFFYQIFACVIPLVSGIVFTAFLGYNITIDKIFTDLLLGSFAIGMNLSGMEIKNDEGIPQILRDIYSLSNKGIIIITIFIYSSLFNGGYIANYFEEKIRHIPIPNSNYWIVLWILGALLLFDITIAVYVECKKK